VSSFLHLLWKCISIEWCLTQYENARDRLLAKIFDFRKTDPGGDIATNETTSFVCICRYSASFPPYFSTNQTISALVTGQLAQDITFVGQEIEQLYGVLNEEDLKHSEALWSRVLGDYAAKCNKIISTLQANKPYRSYQS